MSGGAGARWRTWAAVGLILLGAAPIAADLLGRRAPRALAGALAASPVPYALVWRAEPSGLAVALEWVDPQGTARQLATSPAVRARLRGPSARRAVYAGALAASPLRAPDAATRDMLLAVLGGGLCGSRPLLSELGVDPAQVGSLRIRYTPGPGARLGPLPIVLGVSCR